MTHAPQWTWWREASGSVADLGVLVPLALAMIVVNGLSVTAVFAGAGAAYLAAAAVFRVPVAVQPVKAFAAIAIATEASADEIAAGALMLGAIFGFLSVTGLLGLLARIVPAEVVRGVQVAVGVKFLVVAVGLVAHPPSSFEFVASTPVAVGLGVVLLVVLLVVRRGSALAIVAAAAVFAALAAPGDLGLSHWGPSAIDLPQPDIQAFGSAFVLLVLPQVALTATNACIAPADAAATYFGAAAWRVTPRRLGLSMGLANVAIGAVGGMPVCHGAGGMSAHYLFGARTWRAPALIGTALVVVGVVGGNAVVEFLPWFPLPALAALLAAAGLAHVALARDLRGAQPIAIAVAVAALGVAGYLLIGVVAGAVASHVAAAVRTRHRLVSPPPPRE